MMILREGVTSGWNYWAMEQFKPRETEAVLGALKPRLSYKSVGKKDKKLLYINGELNAEAVGKLTITRQSAM